MKKRPTKPGTIYRAAHAPDPPHFGELDTLAKCFLHQVQQRENQIAMRKKRFGIWQEYRWQDVYRHVKHFSLGLRQLGLRTEETVAIIGDNEPEIYWAQMASHAARARTICIFSDASVEEISYILQKSEAVFFIVHDQEQVDKALAIHPSLPQIRRIIYWEERGLWQYEEEALLRFDEVEALGAMRAEEEAEQFAEAIAQTQPEDTIILSMTSGTTSLPKLAMVTHRQLLYSNHLSLAFFPNTAEDNWLSFSPMAWLTEQAFGYTPHLIHGLCVNFPEGPDTVANDIREIAPIGLVFPSRSWENLVSMMRVRIQDSSWINRMLFAFFMPVAYQIIDRQDAGKGIPFWLQAIRWFGDFAVFQPLRDKIGLTRAKNCLTAGSALSPDVVRFFRAIGVELRQLYASTESLATMHPQGDATLASVGVIPPGVEIKIANDQEILVRTEARFAGYFRDEEKTASVLDEDGWYHTGDAGYMAENGHLYYLDRVQDMLELANGERYSPQYIEGRLKFSPYIRDVMAIGGATRAFVGAIINIDPDNVARWAEKRRIPFTTFVDLSQRREVYELVQRDLAEVNETLPEAARIRRYIILHKAFDADEAELTRTRKLRRNLLVQKYAELIESMYRGDAAFHVRAEVQYRDGRKSTLDTTLHIGDFAATNSAS
ncbi:MAG: AMP-binding protein [Anaerolineaceae bacterium]|nr:AMP-binding protein [Anaerolineaceae bacterium]